MLPSYISPKSTSRYSKVQKAKYHKELKILTTKKQELPTSKKPNEKGGKLQQKHNETKRDADGVYNILLSIFNIIVGFLYKQDRSIEYKKEFDKTLSTLGGIRKLC